MSRAAVSSDSEFQVQIDAIREDFSSLKTDLAALLRDAVAAGRTGACEAKENLEEAIDEKLGQLNSAWKTAQKKGRKAVSQMEDTITERPFQSVGAAFGIGVVLGV